MADGNVILSASKIVKADEQRRYVVVSAPGKRFGNDIKVTDLLYACSDAYEQGDRKTFDAFFSQFSAFVEQVDRILVADSEKMLAKAKDTSNEIGMLRKNTGFSPHKAFLAAGPTQTNGCPGYSRRVRVLLEDCKRRYLAALKAANEYRRQRYLEKPVLTDWQ